MTHPERWGDDTSPRYVISLSPRREEEREQKRGVPGRRGEPSTDRSPWPASIDLLARAPLSNRENIRATERQRETMNRERRLISPAYCIPVIYAFPIRATLRLCSASISIFSFSFLFFFFFYQTKEKENRLERDESIAYIVQTSRDHHFFLSVEK